MDNETVQVRRVTLLEVMDDGSGVSAPEPCRNAAYMGEHACKDRSQCWEPCGELGNSAEHVRVAGVACADQQEQPR